MEVDAATYILSVLAKMYLETGRTIEDLIEDLKNIKVETTDIETPHGTIRLLKNPNIPHEAP